MLGDRDKGTGATRGGGGGGGGRGSSPKVLPIGSRSRKTNAETNESQEISGMKGWLHS